MGSLAGSLRHWIGRHVVPIVLVPLAGLLLWVAIWKVWLPPPGPGEPSRRSGTLAIALLVLGVGSAILGLLHDRIGSLKATTTGFEMTLSPEQKEGAQELVSQLAENDAPAGAYVEGLQRYVAKAAGNGQANDGFKELAQKIASDLAPQ